MYFCPTKSGLSGAGLNIVLESVFVRFHFGNITRRLFNRDHVISILSTSSFPVYNSNLESANTTQSTLLRCRRVETAQTWPRLSFPHGLEGVEDELLACPLYLLSYVWSKALQSYPEVWSCRTLKRRRWKE